MKKNRIILIVSLLLLVLLVGFRLAGNKKKIDEAKKPVDRSNIKIPVTVSNAQMGTVESKMIKAGTLNPYDEATIIASAQGKVTSVQFELGSHVAKGTVLAGIDAQVKQLSLTDAQQLVDKLEHDYKNYKDLLAGDGTTQSKVDEIRRNLDNARNQVAQIKKQMTDYNVLAPISGTITQKNTVPGEFVSPGTVIGKMVDISRLKVQVQVGETDAYQLKTGQVVKITTDIYPDKTFIGKISYISPQGDAAHNFPVEIIIDNAQSTLKAGTFVYADFSRQTTENVLQIPRAALAESLKDPYVYVYQNGLARVRKIQVGRTIGQQIEVTAGLKEGEQVIVTGQINLTDSTKVQIVQ